jgi:hypothetical protein
MSAVADPIAVLRELSTFHRQGAEFCSNLNEALRHENWSEALDTLASQVEALLEDRELLREFVAHTLDEYGERMPSQWKAHARARLANGS